MRRLLIVLLFCSACTPKTTEKLNLVVAASAGPAANAIAQKLAESGFKINVHAGASSLVARQIVNGLPCDVVIMADLEWMDYLEKEKAIDASTRRPFLSNKLVWIVRKGAEAKTDARIALADPEHVPAGKYAKAALVSLGLWAEVAPKLVSAPDVRTALLWVEQGEADSAVVYESDALSSAKVEIRSRLDSKDKPIIYPMAQCRSNNPKSRELYEALNQPLSTEIFRSFGFQIVMHERT